MANDRFLKEYKLVLAREIIERTLSVGLVQQKFLSPLEAANLSLLGFEIVENLLKKPEEVTHFIFRRFITEYKNKAVALLDKNKKESLEIFLNSIIDGMAEEFSQKMAERKSEMARESKEITPPHENKTADVISLGEWKAKNR